MYLFSSGMSNENRSIVLDIFPVTTGEIPMVPAPDLRDRQHSGFQHVHSFVVREQFSNRKMAGVNWRVSGA